MKVLGIVGSPRKRGNTDDLVDRVLEGAKSRGTGSERVLTLVDFPMNPKYPGPQRREKMNHCDSQLRFHVLPEVIPTPGDTALIIIDMQYGIAHSDYGVAKKATEEGRGEIMSYFFQRLPRVIGNIRRIQKACCESKVEVIFVKVQSYTRDGRDFSPSYRINNFNKYRRLSKHWVLSTAGFFRCQSKERDTMRKCRKHYTPKNGFGSAPVAD